MTEVEVPLGKYEVYYCYGDTWYGEKYKFGSQTLYAKADDIFEFYENNEGVYGYTLTLYRVSNGNLDTESIKESQFPG